MPSTREIKLKEMQNRIEAPGGQEPKYPGVQHTSPGTKHCSPNIEKNPCLQGIHNP